jgi:hypothetical protein
LTFRTGLRKNKAEARRPKKEWSIERIAPHEKKKKKKKKKKAVTAFRLF